MTQVDIEGQRSKEEQPSVGYPDICFAIEDFDDAFRGLVSSLHIITLIRARKKPMLQVNVSVDSLHSLRNAGRHQKSTYFWRRGNAHVMARRLCRSLDGAMW